MIISMYYVQQVVGGGGGVVCYNHNVHKCKVSTERNTIKSYICKFCTHYYMRLYNMIMLKHASPALPKAIDSDKGSGSFLL